MKKILFLILAFVLLIAPAFANQDNENNKPVQEKNITELEEQDEGVQAIRVDEKVRREHKENEIRIAVRTLLALENRTGGIGKNVSAIAREFDNSDKNISAAEAKIKGRGRLVRFFFGGDEKSAEIIEKEVAKNNERIAKLQNLLATCTDCDDAAKTLMQEKITALEQENTRLQQLATAEKLKKGLFKRK